MYGKYSSVKEEEQDYGAIVKYTTLESCDHVTFKELSINYFKIWVRL